MARAHQISDAHMVCTPHPRISRIFLISLGVLVGFGFSMMVWRKKVGKWFHDLSLLLPLLIKTV